MILVFFVLSVLTGLLRGGKLSRLFYLEFKSIWLFLVAMGIQLALVVFGATGNVLVLEYIQELYIISYVLLLIGLFINIKYRSVILVVLGSVMNLFCFMMNSRKMPVSIGGLKLAGYDNLVNLVKSGNIALYTPLTEKTKYAQLSQLITIQKPFPFPQILSIGDIVIYIGIFIFVQSAMLDTNSRYSRRRKRY